MDNDQMQPQPQAQGPSNMAPVFITVGVIAVVAIAGWLLLRSGTETESVELAPEPRPPQEQTNVPSTNTATNEPVSTSPTNTPTSTNTPPPVQPVVKSFTVTGQNFSFSPSTIMVKRGDTVRITFVNSGGTHDFKIAEFSVATQRIGDGQPETVQFVADRAGSFEYYCSVGNHRATGMRGTLVVTPS